MSISDIIQISAIIASFLVGVISIVISVKTLRVTRKSIEDANRPYIAIYREDIFLIGHQKYLVLKNFGQSGAVIKKITIEPPFNSESQKWLNNPFEDLTNFFIAPGQKLETSILDSTQSFDNQDRTIHICYDAQNGKTYNETIFYNKSPRTHHCSSRIRRSNATFFEECYVDSIMEIIRHIL